METSHIVLLRHVVRLLSHETLKEETGKCTYLTVDYFSCAARLLQLTSKWNISCLETLGHKTLPLACLLAHNAALARSMDSSIRLNVLFGFQEN